jgi:CheY-like chemotaxis protein
MPVRKILLVEDSPVVRHSIRQALKTGGIPDGSILEAGTAREAIDLFDKEGPDVVFCDINLPLGAPLRPGGETIFGFLSPSVSPTDGGTEAARYMLGRNPSLRLVVCTGNPPDDPRVRDLVKAGAFDVLQKPVRSIQIRQVIDRLHEDTAE